MNDIYSALEFDEIRNQISKYSKSEIGKKLVDNISIISNKDKLDNELSILNEMISYLYKYGLFVSIDSDDLNNVIDRANKGASFSIEDILKIRKDYLLAKSIKALFLERKEADFPLLFAKTNQLKINDEILKRINSLINENNEIRKDASKTLAGLYKRKESLDKKLATASKKELEKYKDFIVDNTTYSYRDNHLLLHVNTSYKTKVKGLIYGTSSSKQTTFIEPYELCEISNDIYLNNKDIEDEIKRLLIELTNYIVSFSEEVLSNNKIIGYFDFLISKALFAKERNCNVVKFDNDGIINLKNAYHPLIDKEKVIKNDFYIDKDKRILLISGPNAGGKTVSLKTFVLNILLLKCGLALFASEESKISEIKYIYFDIGDNQSITNNLSTFSAHIKNIAHILKKVKENDLVILDELGTGTSPKEGEALSVAITDKLVNLKAFALISSHFELLKAFALSNPNINNASMEFNEEKLFPTYKLKLNSLGKSYGIELAGRFNLESDIIKSAKKILKDNNDNYLEDAIKQLKKKEQEIERINLDLAKKEEELTNKLNEQEEIIESYKNKIRHFNSEINEEKEEVLNNALVKIDALLKEAYSKDKPHEIINIKKELESLSNDYLEEENPVNNEEINVNDHVIILNSSIEGIVNSISKNKLVITTSEGLKIKANKNDVKKITSSKKKIKINIKVDAGSESVPISLNLVGYRVDEALIKLEEYLDNAKLHNIKEVSVIHGYGSGALRNAIHEYLSKQKYVKEFGLDDNNFNHGITIIKLC